MGTRRHRRTSRFRPPDPYWPKKPGFSKAYWLLRYTLELVMRCFYRVQLEGADNLPRRGPAILAANHLSAFDPPFIAIAVRRRITALANARYFTSRNGWFFRGMGQIPLVPGDDTSRDQAFECALDLLSRDRLIGIFPEGNRSLDGKLHRGRLGVATLARVASVPVVPIGILGTFEVLPKGRTMPRVFRRITVRVGTPLRATHTTPAGDRPFTDTVMSAVAGLTGQERSDTYTESRRKSVTDEASA